MVGGVIAEASLGAASARRSRARIAPRTTRPTVPFVRPEYARLADEFVRLAGAFGHAVDPRLQGDIARLASSIERIDRCIDDAPSDAERRARWALVVDGLRDDRADTAVAVIDLTTGHVEVTDGHAHVTDGYFDVSSGHFAPGGRDELAAATAELRALGEERGALDRIRRLVTKEAATSEALRTARTRRTFRRLVEREGRLTGALALVVAGDACDRPFRRFFFRLAGPANIVDKILDVKGDFARGEMCLEPDLALYATLFGALFVRGVALLAACPRPLFLADLCLRYLQPIGRSESR